MAKMRSTQRRNKIITARGKAEEEVALALAPVFRSQHKKLERFLRKANLKKRMNKITTVAIVDNPNISMDEISSIKAVAIMKADMGPSDWEEWRRVAMVAMAAALAGIVAAMLNIENEMLLSRGLTPIELTVPELIAAYEQYTNSSFGDALDSTMRGIERELAQWYAMEEPFPMLMTRMNKWFDRNRIELIAQMVVGRIINQATLKTMRVNGWSQWYWDATGEKPCSVPLAINGQQYEGCIDLHGRKFSIGDPMPPDAAHAHCHCLPSPVMQ